MPASELFRFRTVRAVAAKQSNFNGLIVSPKAQHPLQSFRMALATNPALLLGPFQWLQIVSDQLGSVADFMAPGAVAALLSAQNSTWLTDVQCGAWATIAQTLADALTSLALEAKNTPADNSTYGIPVISASTCQEVELVTRLVLVQDFVANLAADKGVAEGQKRFQTAKDVQVALSFRSRSALCVFCE